MTFEKRKKIWEPANARERCPRHWTEKRDAFFFSLSLSLSLCSMSIRGVRWYGNLGFPIDRNLFAAPVCCGDIVETRIFGVVVVVKNSFVLFAKVFTCSRCKGSAPVKQIVLEVYARISIFLPTFIMLLNYYFFSSRKN
jgi:hypothetical protein